MKKIQKKINKKNKNIQKINKELENKKIIKKPKDPIDRDLFDSFPASDPSTKY